MRIFVTGAAGFIGSNLVRHLIINGGHSVLGFDKLTYAGNLSSLDDLRSSNHFRFTQGDICDHNAIAMQLESFRPHAIMHLAAESHVDRSIDGPETFIQTNVVGTFRLLQASRNYFNVLNAKDKSHFRFHHISTDEVYGSLGPTDKPFSESTPYAPHSPYSASKAASDHLVRAWHDTYGLPTLISNCSNNYGPYQFPEKLIPVVILKCLHGQQIPIYGNGENIRDWLYVDDHCKALECVLLHGKSGETYNIGGNNELKNIELVKLLCQIMDQLSPNTIPKNQLSHSSLISFVKDRPGHDARYAIDATKITQTLGWRPQEDGQSGFVRTVEWYLKNMKWWQEVLSGNYNLERQGLEG